MEFKSSCFGVFFFFLWGGGRTFELSELSEGLRIYVILCRANVGFRLDLSSGVKDRGLLEATPLTFNLEGLIF